MTTEWPLWSGGTPAGPDPVPSTPGAAGTPDTPVDPAPTCPSCGRPINPSALFCEACGNPLVPTVAATPASPASPSAGDSSTRTRRLGERASALADCPVCGGSVGADGYCQTCGAKAPSARDHFTASPAPWVGGVCDRGVQHSRNEDAMALWAEQDRAVLVVCDGVSSSIDSDVAALAGAEKARDVLVALNGDGDGDEDAALASALVTATEEANKAVIAHTAPDSTNAASATFAAAVVLNDRVHYANLGDSRVYLLTPGEKVLLSLDDSLAQAFISEGMPRSEAESLPRAHAITKWLGRDAIDTIPRTGHHPVTEPGWLVVCSDGLWNYASSPEELSAQVDAAAAASSDPVEIAGRLVVWANAQGGRDNVTVALARVPAGAPTLGSIPSEQRKESAQHG